MPKNSERGFAHILILVAAIGVIAFLVISSSAIFKDKLFSGLFPKSASHAAGNVTRGQAGDLWADVVLGQPDFGMLTPNQVVPNKLFLTFGGGTIVDRSVSPGRLYVWDGGNSRVLGLDLAKCYGQSLPCSADIVIGQPSSTDHSACNGDNNFQNLLPTTIGVDIQKSRAPASASSLCGVTDNQASILENISASNMYVDSQGNLYVPDHKNNRVLKYTSPFTTDTVADAVWGQDDFSGNLCNKSPEADSGNTTASSSSLCFGWEGGGVTTDPQGNVWVADSENNRVLRFPNGSKTSDLVLGQSSFTSRGTWSYGASLNQMHGPVGLGFGANGKLYVADNGNNRVLVFDGPFTNGMNATGTLGSDICGPAGLDIDPSGAGVWVQDDCAGHSRTVLFDFSGNVKTILGKDTMTNNNECAGQACNAVGSIGIDTEGNVLLTNGRYVNDVLKFSAPFPDPSPGLFYHPSKRLFLSPNGGNQAGSKGLSSVVSGVAITPNQFIITDGRILFWNNPDSLSNGKPADGVIVPDSPVQDFTSISPTTFGSTVSDGQRLWVGLGWPNTAVWVYQLPLTTGAQPIKKIALTPLPVLGGGQITGNDGILGIDVQGDGQYLWVTQGGEYTNIHRAFRIKNPLTNPVVDVVLGQPNATSTGCNRDANTLTDGYTYAYSLKAANTVCFPSLVKVDKLGNVWVSDYSLEFKGNWRLLEYNANLFSNITTTALFGPDASKIFPNTFSTGLAFDSQNRMVVGNGLGGGHFYSVFDNPLGPSTSPDRKLNDYYSIAGAVVFDSQDNLYTSDINRARVLFYKKPFTAPTPTPPNSKRVFITSTKYTASPSGGGIGRDIADTQCQARANAASLGGVWKVWLSYDGSSAGSRILHSTIPYVGLDGLKIADNWNDLTDGTIQNPIIKDELGGSQAEEKVWTGTKQNGDTFDLSTCYNFNSNSGSGRYGMVGRAYLDGKWTNFNSQSCLPTYNAHLYCFEQ